MTDWNDAVFEKHIKGEFLTEARELLEATETAFRELEHSRAPAPLLDRIFRLAHTIKGGAYSVGFTAFADHAHQLETLLDALRKGDLPVNRAAVDVLLEASDVLRGFVRTMAADVNGVYDATRSLANIQACLLDRGRPASAEATSPVQVRVQVQAPEQVQARPVAPSATTPNAQPRRPRVLICDDEPGLRALIGSSVAELGCEVLEAENGADALTIAAECKPDLIITDLRMPKMDGLTFMRNLRVHDTTTPVILVTGHAGAKDIAAFLRLGVAAYLEKPYSDDELRFQVERALRTKRTADAAMALCRLSFRAYLLQKRLHRELAATNSAAASELEDCLGHIAALTRTIVVGDAGGSDAPAVSLLAGGY